MSDELKLTYKKREKENHCIEGTMKHIKKRLTLKWTKCDVECLGKFYNNSADKDYTLVYPVFILISGYYQIIQIRDQDKPFARYNASWHNSELLARNIFSVDLAKAICLKYAKWRSTLPQPTADGDRWANAMQNRNFRLGHCLALD
ncbi:MAG: hypothetical protein Q8M94_17745 [Ignavibacteria bacterium]|nr:hypothetical protein [Ignavibacteria bacterium]